MLTSLLLLSTLAPGATPGTGGVYVSQPYPVYGYYVAYPSCYSCYGCYGCYGYSLSCYGCYGCYGCTGCYGCYGCFGCSGCYGCYGYAPIVNEVTVVVPEPYPVVLPSYCPPIVEAPMVETPMVEEGKHEGTPSSPGKMEKMAEKLEKYLLQLDERIRLIEGKMKGQSSPIVPKPKVEKPIQEKKADFVSTTRSGVDLTTRAVVRVSLPSAARLFVDGKPLGNSGTNSRAILTPELEPGETYTYQVRVEYDEDGQPISRVRKVQFQAGQQLQVDFNSKKPAVDRIVAR